ncbi:hypothetical protein DNTS_012418 [Danionella cerebrum]|uniref:Uncharacterized protein n=1 Tax=Danionella cerebrum TaxID=2873325 RepID=A0A553QJD5_9TELE|nr:hypothetical protein DNTS_012418 [Danionella translucida]
MLLQRQQRWEHVRLDILEHQPCQKIQTETQRDSRMLLQRQQRWEHVRLDILEHQPLDHTRLSAEEKLPHAVFRALSAEVLAAVVLCVKYAYVSKTTRVRSRCSGREATRPCWMSSGALVPVPRVLLLGRHCAPSTSLEEPCKAGRLAEKAASLFQEERGSRMTFIPLHSPLQPSNAALFERNRKVREEDETEMDPLPNPFPDFLPSTISLVSEAVMVQGPRAFSFPSTLIWNMLLYFKKVVFLQLYGVIISVDEQRERKKKLCPSSQGHRRMSLEEEDESHSETIVPERKDPARKLIVD